jgi:hypothetical protein
MHGSAKLKARGEALECRHPAWEEILGRRWQ